MPHNCYALVKEQIIGHGYLGIITKDNSCFAATFIGFNFWPSCLAAYCIGSELFIGAKRAIECLDCKTVE